MPLFHIVNFLIQPDVYKRQLYGNAAMIDGICDRVFEELGYEARIIATGCIGVLIMPYFRHEIVYEPDLLTKGLSVLWEKANNNN